jgi:ribonuclease HIII
MPAAKYSLKLPPRRRQFKEALIRLPAVAWTEKGEQYCEYRLDGRVSGGWLRAKQFTNGTLYLEASDEALLARMTTLLDPTGAPAGGNIASAAGTSANGHQTALIAPARTPGLGVSASGLLDIRGEYIGTDESGKGDYFGPLVVAAVRVTDETAQALRQLGVTDSKKLTDSRIDTIYRELLSIVGENAVATVELEPARYNALYERFKSEGKNLNHLLAWGHATVLEALLVRFPDCRQAIADQFGNERYILSQLQEKGRGIDLRQTPRAEANVGVAAASIVARWRFTQGMKALSDRFNQALPLGAGPIVKTAARRLLTANGRDVLTHVVKLHFKTTAEL